MKIFNLIGHNLFIPKLNIDIKFNFDKAPIGLHSTYIDNIFSTPENDLTHSNFIISNMLFDNSHSKIDILKTNCFDNIFLNQIGKNNIIDFFYKIQHTWYVLYNFVNRIKRSYYKTKVDNDLYLNPIVESQKNCFKFFSNTNVYLFTLHDLSKIIISSICNSPDFHSHSLIPRNPYDGIDFTRSDLYNIYFAMKNTFINVPIIIHQYFLSNFDIKFFETNNQVIIRDNYIKQFIQNEDSEDIIDHVHDMLIPYNEKMNIDHDFPDNILIEELKTELLYYLYYTYSLDNSKKHSYRIKLKNAMYSIIKKTPSFGRKIINIENNKKYYSFVTKNGNTEKILYTKPIRTIHETSSSSSSTTSTTSSNNSLVINNYSNTILSSSIDPIDNDFLNGIENMNIDHSPIEVNNDNDTIRNIMNDMVSQIENTSIIENCLFNNTRINPFSFHTTSLSFHTTPLAFNTTPLSFNTTPLSFHTTPLSFQRHTIYPSVYDLTPRLNTVPIINEETNRFGNNICDDEIYDDDDDDEIYVDESLYDT